MKTIAPEGFPCTAWIEEIAAAIHFAVEYHSLNNHGKLTEATS